LSLPSKLFFSIWCWPSYQSIEASVARKAIQEILPFVEILTVAAPQHTNLYIKLIRTAIGGDTDLS
jgi:hypothetical protein